MKRRGFYVCFVLLLAGWWTVCMRAADDKAAKPAGAGEPNMEEMMKKMAAIATPGPGHKVLEALVGEWEVETRMWMGGQGTPSTESKGSSSAKWVLGGRYLQETFTGEMMGQKFEGLGITAYDNFRKHYTGVWMDTMGTGIFISEGSADADGKVLTFTGKMDEPMSGEKDKPAKYIIRILSPDKHTMEMHDLTLGDKSKVFELTYTRKK
jgi:hypothetical protein